jgi:predicted aspartyl protease
MRRVSLACCLLSLPLFCEGQTAPDLKTLYAAHSWRELQGKLGNATDAALYRGAIGVTFNQDPRRSERLLLEAIRSNPHSEDAYEAYEWLSHLYFYRGRYRSLVSIMAKRWAAFPEKKDNADERTAIEGFLELPDQILESTGPSKLTHDPGSIFVPLSVNGKAATWFFDTGAWVSSISESEAKRFGMTIRNTAGAMGQSAGAQVGFRTAVAKDVVIGNSHFRNVSFAVFPDAQEPWSNLEPGRRGIIGMPLLVGLGTIRWEVAGDVQFAQPSAVFDIRASNLAFDNDHLVVSAVAEDRNIAATVDTGAVTTDLYKPFADLFEELLNRKGRKDSTEVRGIGHAERFDSITLPDLRIRLGGADTMLSPAHVLLKSIGAACCVGNFGMDLFRQAPVLKIDFGVMTLRLLPVREP